MEAIARWLGMTRGQVKPLIDAGVLPTFRPPGPDNLMRQQKPLNEVVQAWSKGGRALTAAAFVFIK